MMKRRPAIFALAIIALFALGIASMPTQKAHATEGVEGEISAGVSSVFLNNVVAIKCFNMDVSADYSLQVNDVATDNWTNGASQTSRTFFKTFESTQVSGGMVKIGLANTTLPLVEIYLSVTEVADLVDTDFAFDLFTPFLILGILIAVLAAILGGGFLGVKKLRAR